MVSLFGKIRMRLKAQKGETLVETLVAVLVCTMAAVMLSTGVASATRLNANAHEHEQAIRSDVKAAEIAGASGVLSSTAQVTVVPDGGSPQSYSVVVYGGADEGSASEVVAYMPGD